MPDQEREYGRFAEALREAFRRLRVAGSDEDKARLTRRLLAVTRAARHDLRAAARKLELVIDQFPRLTEARRSGREDGRNHSPDSGHEVGG
jgi:hypothetical protein